jgi:CRISPR-associated protein Cas8a1/Csx13
MEDLTLDLFAPGMGTLHRAGLGGLACTLGRTNWPKNQWEIDSEGRQLALRWPGGASGARAFLEALYARAFDLDQGMIHLPGAYGPDGINPWIKAELQRGMSLTILQFGPNRKARNKVPLVVQYEVDDHKLTVEHQDLVDYTHREAWRDLVTPKGELREAVEIAGTIAPGFVQRHVVHGATTIQQPPGHAIALHFALVGTVSLAVGHGGTGVLIVPDVQNLREFVRRRPFLNPGTARDCHITSPADGALQAQLRLRAAEAGLGARVERCVAIRFSSTMWNPNQKGRISVLDVDPRASDLDFFETVMGFDVLRQRVVEAKPEKKGQQPRKFWAGGVVRAFVAENLAHHRPWFHDFRKLIVGSDGKDDAQNVRQLSFEREGLQKMTDQPWEDQGEETLIRAIHQAMSQTFGKIWEDAGKDTTTFQNRSERQMERWRLALAHAKTADDVRGGLSDIWGRAGQVPVLMDSWRLLLPVLCDERRWQLNRDLALLALSSYKSPRKQDPATNDAQPPST